MRTFLFLAVYGACFTSKHACASPAGTKPPHSLITPAPVLHKRFTSDFVGYALFTDGDTSIITCRTGLTYTYTDGYAGCVSTLGDLGTFCAGSTLFLTGGSSAVCSTACITDFLYYSLDDKSPAWGVKCATRTSGWKVLHMSESDLPSMSTDTITQPIDTSIPPTTKVVVITSVVASTSTSPAPPPTPPPTGTSKPSKNNGALIGGAVAGSLVFLGLVIAGVFFFLSRRRPTQGFSDQPAAQNPPFMGKEQPASPPTSPYVGVDQSQAVSPAPFSPPPVSFSPPPASFSPPPASFSPPPEYPQDKSPSTTVSMVSPVQQSNYGAAGETYQAYGEPAYTNELPAHYAQPQRRSELG